MRSREPHGHPENDKGSEGHHFSDSSSLLGPGLRTLHWLFLFIFTSTLWERLYSHPHLQMKKLGHRVTKKETLVLLERGSQHTSAQTSKAPSPQQGASLLFSLKAAAAAQMSLAQALSQVSF